MILGVAVAELTVQYSQITDSGAMLWTPLLFRKRISGRVVIVAGEEDRSKGEGFSLLINLDLSDSNMDATMLPGSYAAALVSRPYDA